MVQLTRQLTSVAVWLPPKKQVQQHLKQKKKNRKTPNTCQDTNAFARPRRGNCHYHNTRTYYIAYAFKHEDNSQRADVRTMFLCVMPPRLCFLEQKNLTRLDDWGLCAHQRCAFGKTVTAGAKGGGKIVVTVNWKQKTKTPHLENLNTVLVSCTFSQTTVLVASTVQQQLCSPHWWR